MPYYKKNNKKNDSCREAGREFLPQHEIKLQTADKSSQEFTCRGYRFQLVFLLDFFSKRMNETSSTMHKSNRANEK